MYLRYGKSNIVILKGKRLCFEVLIPIIEESKFRAYHLVALPTEQLRDKGTLKFIGLEYNYIILEAQTHSFMPSSKVELDACIKHDNKGLFQRHVPQYSTVAQDPCLRIATKTLLKPAAKFCPITVVRVMNKV